MPKYIGYNFTGTANTTVVTPALNGGVTDSKYNSGIWSMSDSSGEENSIFTRRKQGNWPSAAGIRHTSYLGAKIIQSNTSVTFPSSVAFAVVKLWGGVGFGPSTGRSTPYHYGQGGYTAIKLGANSAGQTYYITTDGTENPEGTTRNPNYPATPPNPGNFPYIHEQLGGGYVSISTGPMAPGAGPIPARQNTVLGLAGGGGGRSGQSERLGGSAGYPAGYPGPDYIIFGGVFGTHGGLGGNASPPPSPPPSNFGSALAGKVSGQAGRGGGGNGWDGGDAGTYTPADGGRSSSGGGGSNYIVSPSNPHISGVANSTYSHPVGFDTYDPDYAYPNFGLIQGPSGLIPGFGKPPTYSLNFTTASTGCAIIKFFKSEEPNYDSPQFPANIPTSF